VTGGKGGWAATCGHWLDIPMGGWQLVKEVKRSFYFICTIVDSLVSSTYLAYNGSKSSS
jgi:hypothetical protein